MKNNNDFIQKGFCFRPFSCEAPTNYPLSNYLPHQAQNLPNQNSIKDQEQEQQKENKQIICISKNAEPFEIEITTSFTHKIRSRPN